MSSGQESYNQLSEKLRKLVPVKNSKQMLCHLGQVANYLPVQKSQTEGSVLYVKTSHIRH